MVTTGFAALAEPGINPKTKTADIAKSKVAAGLNLYRNPPHLRSRDLPFGMD